ncbi:protein of unknown function [Lachnospiraceae bacterium KH1T2]|nr:protein of unknown function [Lachnospiraceae bacterium KH1T2]
MDKIFTANNYYIEGLDDSYPDEFGRLEMLVRDNTFEVLNPEKSEPGIRSDIRVVYTMSDAVESFLIFKNCLMTGYYDVKFDEHAGEYDYISAMIDREGDGYVLIVHQGENSVFTLYFDRLECEDHLYSYSNIGHFWVKEYEYIRQIEYKAWIISTKLKCLGDGACTDMEKRLASLVDFPPLNANCYPAYISEDTNAGENVWQASDEAIDLMEEIAVKSNDMSLLRNLEKYRNLPTEKLARRIAYKLHMVKHVNVTQKILHMLNVEGSKYPRRIFDTETEQLREKLIAKAEFICRKDREAGMKSEIYTEEPFIAADDGTKLSVYVLRWVPKLWNMKSSIVKIDS